MTTPKRGLLFHFTHISNLASIARNGLYQEGRERRMAEMLVYRLVPWNAFLGVATRSEARNREVSQALATVGAETFVGVRPEWYF